MKKEDFEFWSVLLLLVISAGINFAWIFHEMNINLSGFFSDKNKSNISEVIALCENLSLQDSVKCINSEIKPFFKYNKTNDEVTFEQLKEYGGNCVAWSDFWAEAIQDLGFKAKYVTLYMGKNEGHVFVVAYDEYNYCNIDQVHYDCGVVI